MYSVRTMKAPPPLGRSPKPIARDSIKLNAGVPSYSWGCTSGVGVQVAGMSLPPESGSHNEMHNLVYGRCYGKDKPGAVHAGI